MKEAEVERMKARFKSLEDLLEKTVKEIDRYASSPADVRELNPLYAHIKIAQILNDIIPVLKYTVDMLEED